MDMSENAHYTVGVMRGADTKQSSMFCLLSPESVVPEKHPLRVLLPRVDEILRRLSPVFDEMYSAIGRPSIPPERLLKGTLLMALYTIRSERQFCDQLGYNLLFRWFLGMDMVEPAFNHSTFSQNRERLLAHDVAGLFFREVVELARGAGLMSDDHFTVDGTLIEAWASMKSFQPKKADQGEEQPTTSEPGVDPNNEGVNFRGEHRSNETHASTTDPEARLMRKGRGKEAKLSYSAHALMENRNGLLVDLLVMPATGTAEREAALEMIDRSLPGQRRITLGAENVLHLPEDLAVYEYDATIERARPDVVVFPSTAEDVAAAVRIAVQHDVPVVPRGSGTGLSGGAVPILGGVLIVLTRMNRILDALSANDLRLKIEVIDHGSIIDGFQKVANRIALGLVLAALIVGAAMLMRVQTPFTILGYPGLAMLLFLAAAGGGFWMAWTILAGDVRTRIR